jgi:hypothetical protein
VEALAIADIDDPIQQIWQVHMDSVLAHNETHYAAITTEDHITLNYCVQRYTVAGRTASAFILRFFG